MQMRPNDAIVIELDPTSLVKLAMPTERGARDGFGGSRRFQHSSNPGPYQVTTFDDAWIDVIQDDQIRKGPLAAVGADFAGGTEGTRRLQDQRPGAVLPGCKCPGCVMITQVL
jgi:hypothetical protein